MLGGGMRQAGVIAAAGLHALEHGTARLGEDHARAARLAAALREAGATVRQATNMVFLTVAEGRAGALRSHMARHGIRIGGGMGEIRLVLHRDVDDASLATASDAFGRFLAGR